MLPQINAAKTTPISAPSKRPNGGAARNAGYDHPAIVDAPMMTTAMKPLRNVRVSKRKRFNSAPTGFVHLSPLMARNKHHRLGAVSWCPANGPKSKILKRTGQVINCSI
jgi:hypothetical protein